MEVIFYALLQSIGLLIFKIQNSFKHRNFKVHKIKKKINSVHSCYNLNSPWAANLSSQSYKQPLLLRKEKKYAREL